MAALSFGSGFSSSGWPVSLACLAPFSGQGVAGGRTFGFDGILIGDMLGDMLGSLVLVYRFCLGMANTGLDCKRDTTIIWRSHTGPYGRVENEKLSDAAVSY